MTFFQGNRVGTLLADNMRKFAKFESYFNRLESIMREIESALQRFLFRLDYSSRLFYEMFLVILDFYKPGVLLNLENCVTCH